MLFSYNSSPAIDSSNAAVEDHANTLLQALSLNRLVSSHILFILGGKYVSIKACMFKRPAFLNLSLMTHGPGRCRANLLQDLLSSFATASAAS